ncbi:MAG TPA: HD domain-containing phosphohydrolase [Telluria sp.]|nr:HD domain-containing phosphohydrolase [Telluria sp.]
MNINFEATVLIAASAPDRAQAMKEALQGRFEVRHAPDGAQAAALMQQSPRPDVVVLDVSLAGPDAWTLCQDFKSNFLTAQVPVLMVADAADSARAYAEGAADVVTLPLEPAALTARVAAHVELRRSRLMLKDQASLVESLVAERSRELLRLQDATLLAMATLAEGHEEHIHNHLLRIQHYVTALVRELRFHPRFEAELTDANGALIAKAAILHDIGMAGVPDAILLKPGKLTPEEFNVMRQHTTYGRQAIEGVEQTLGFSTPFLGYAKQIVYAHQERWDGTGYPQGLRGDAIPLAARIMAVADVYDALISRRRYRPAFTHETALELVRHGREEHFDPDVVDAMLAIEEKILAIADEFRDPE